MKKILILVLGLVAGSASFALPSDPQTSAAQTRLVMTPDQKVKLYIQPLQTKAQLTIWDAAGHAVYSETVALQKGLRQQFDVASLGTGTYRLTLTTGDITTSQAFVLQANPNESFVVQQP